MTTSIPREAEVVRLSELDGLRGWASLSVVLFHVFWEMFGRLVPEFRNPLSAGLLNGPFAVSIFFVLSGEALSVAYWNKENPVSVLHMALKRYPRLAIPVFFSSLAVLLLMKSGLVFSKEAAAIVGREDWLGAFLQLTPDWPSFLRYSLFDVFRPPSPPMGKAFNPFLWTMPIELAGSFLVFLLLLSHRPLTRLWKPAPIILAFALTLLFFHKKSLIACFSFGMLFGWMHARGHFIRLRGLSWMVPCSAALMLGVLALAGYKQLTSYSSARFLTIASALFIFAIHCQGQVTHFLRNNTISRFLGHISFPLYLVHFAVLISVSSFLVVLAKEHGMISIAVIGAISLLSIVSSVVLAVLFLPVETLTHRVCRWFVSLLPWSERPSAASVPDHRAR